MSSDRPSDARLRQPDGGAAVEEAAALVRARGAPLIEAVEQHLPGAEDHAEGTGAYTFVAAVELGFDRGACQLAAEAAKLHEVGLVYVPAEVIAKRPRERDAAEAETFAGHFEAGYRLAHGAGIPEQVCGWLLRQRERFDGGGPEGLAGDRIPIEARMIRAACLCQSALAGAGQGDQALGLDRARALLDAAAGSELDPAVAAALEAVLRRAGSG
jgi:HD-GYP domain-containing protein (c-di-GMP phosphodiesterase class II)